VPETEVLGAGPETPRLERAARAAVAAAGIGDGHLAVAIVSPEEIRRLNREHRGVDAETDVLSFPVDEEGAPSGPRELGDVVVCPERAADLEEAVVHGVLHLCGLDHESDEGEMLTLQDAVMAELRAA
jgi:probable rRNA maturation factor